MKKSAFYTVLTLSVSTICLHYAYAQDEGADEEELTCMGLPADIVAIPGVTTNGTPGPDVIVGTEGADIIAGNDGDDVICGRGGNDTILGNRGNDYIDGDRGADIIYGGQDDDTMFGSGNRDTIIGGSGTDSAFGNQGRDFCDAESTVGCEDEPAAIIADED